MYCGRVRTKFESGGNRRVGMALRFGTLAATWRVTQIQTPKFRSIASRFLTDSHSLARLTRTRGHEFRQQAPLGTNLLKGIWPPTKKKKKKKYLLGCEARTESS